MTSRFQQQVMASRGGDIYLVQGRDDRGRPAWYYLLVDRDKKALFEHDIADGNAHLPDYGRILVSGFGTNVPDTIHAMMAEKYGFQ